MSKPLNALVHGEMKEASDGVAVWPEVDEGTFVRFWEFAYTGNYTAPKPAIVLALETQSSHHDEARKEPSPEEHPAPPAPPARPVLEAEIDEEHVMSDRFDRFGFSRPQRVNKSKRMPVTGRDELWNQFKKLNYHVPSPPPSPEKMRSPSLMDHSEVFLSHARIYVLADYYDIEALMVLSLKRLHQALVGFEFSRNRADDVTAVVDYCYGNTVDKGGNQDRLRHLLALYTACKVETMWPSTYFQEILERSGELSKAVIKNMLDRLD